MSDFEWVKARAACSVVQMFERLKLEIQQDIKDRNDLRPENERYYGFKFVAAKDSFAVVRQGNQISGNTAFFCYADRIEIVRDEKPLFTAKVRLNDDGECVFDINGAEKHSWHLRNMALASLFFEGL
jgi:hypothetical protein